MKYTKLLIGVLVVIVVIGSIMGLRGKKVELITPDKIISYNEASEAVGGYNLKQSDVIKTGNKLEVNYNAEPIGSGDNVKIELIYYSDDYKRSDVETMYNSERERLQIYEDVAETGEKAFIAFPSIYVYESGFCIKITAGSGSDSEQSILLKKLAQTAVKNLDKYLVDKRIK